MKKVLAILFAALLMFSFAGCVKYKSITYSSASSDEGAKNTTASTDKVADKTETITEKKTEKPTELIEILPDVPQNNNSNKVPANTVEAWIAANKDVVDTFCADNSESDETVKNSVTMQVTAKGNVLYMSMIFAGPDVDVILEYYDEYAAEEQASWDALTAEEKLEEIADFAAEIDESMPVPEKIVMNICKDTASNVVASIICAR